MFKKLQKVFFFGIISCVLISFISLRKMMDSPSSRDVPNANVSFYPQKTFVRQIASRSVKSEKPVQVVIITAYQHSGSSLLGSIFNQHPLSVYYYEPVAALYMSTMHVHRWQTSHRLNYQQDGSRRMRSISEKEMMEHYFGKMSHCELGSVPPELCPHIWLSGQRTKCTPNCTIDYPRDFRRSMLTEESLRHIPCEAMNDADSMKRCYCWAASIVKSLEPLCKTMKLVVMKILRYELGHIISIVEKDPNWSLIHQVRDPRGLVNSYVTRRPNITEHKVRMLARKLCSSMSDHIELVKEFESRTSKRNVFIARYEDLAMHPQDFSAKIYERLGAVLPSEVERWIQSVTRSRSDEGKYRRANSSVTALMWKQKLPKHYLSLINDECQSLYKYFENTDSFFV